MSANSKFAKALKECRLKFNLSQSAVARIAGLHQAEYAAFESEVRKLKLDIADNISSKVWGLQYTDFVKEATYGLILSSLPPKTQEAITLGSNKKLRSTLNLLAKELDRLIENGFLDEPKTAKELLYLMDKKLHTRKPMEITNLLGKAPRNRFITIIGKTGREYLFVKTTDFPN